MYRLVMVIMLILVLAFLSIQAQSAPIGQEQVSCEDRMDALLAEYGTVVNRMATLSGENRKLQKRVSELESKNKVDDSKSKAESK